MGAPPITHSVFRQEKHILHLYKLKMFASQISMEEREMVKKQCHSRRAKQLLGIEVVNIPSIIYGGS